MIIPPSPQKVFNDFRAQSEGQLIDQIIHEKQAEELGIVATDSMVTDYLDRLRTQYDKNPNPNVLPKPICQVSTQEIEALISEMRKTSNSFSYEMAMQELKKFLLRGRYYTTGLNAFATDPPLARWDNYTHVARRAG